jgi:hypothetical protein
VKKRKDPLGIGDDYILNFHDYNNERPLGNTSATITQQLSIASILTVTDATVCAAKSKA